MEMEDTGLGRPAIAFHDVTNTCGTDRCEGAEVCYHKAMCVDLCTA